MDPRQQQMGTTKKLMAQLGELDKKIADNELVLKKNNTDMLAPLVDEEGYPLAEMDVYSVRKARHTIICLQNDRKAVEKQIEASLHELHRTNSEVAATTGTDYPIVHRTSNDPFARIEMVAPNSPADAAGFEKGDLVIQFHTLHAGNFESLQHLKEVVESMINKTIRVSVLRDMHVKRLELCPRAWSGNGVLGCLFVEEKLPKQ